MLESDGGAVHAARGRHCNYDCSAGSDPNLCGCRKGGGGCCSCSKLRANENPPTPPPPLPASWPVLRASVYRISFVRRDLSESRARERSIMRPAGSAAACGGSRRLLAGFTHTHIQLARTRGRLLRKCLCLWLAAAITPTSVRRRPPHSGP